MSQLWANLPAQLTERANWVIAGTDKIPYTLAPDGRLIAANVNDAVHLTFLVAAEYAYRNRLLIGYALKPDDGMSCIDIDVTTADTQRAKGKVIDSSKWTTREDHDRFLQIVKTFDSYTERSHNGLGLHIWVGGKVGEGRRRDGLEVYGQGRYLICTGDSIHQPVRPIRENTETLALMVGQMNRSAPEAIPLIELAPTETDDAIWIRARTAINGDEFAALCSGDFSSYPSQSEADYALLSFLTFYSMSNEQVRRMFRVTALGQRAKATRNDDYIDRSLRRIRAKQQVEMAAQTMIAPQIQQIANTLLATVNNPTTDVLVAEIERSKRRYEDSQLNVVQASPVSTAMTSINPPIKQTEQAIEWPPGLTGALAWFLFRASPRPVPEIAILTALGYLAGVCGRTYTFSNSGLNLYLVLIAGSGVGKEALHSGLHRIVNVVKEHINGSERFVDFTQYQSGNAIYKAVATNPSFVNVIGEVGRKIERMSNDRDTSASSFRDALLNLYQKSGDSVIGALGYSDSDKNTTNVSGVAYSMIGETTPKVLFESLSESMMADGLVSRFSFLEYTGDRVPLNYNQVTEPELALSSSLKELASQSLSLLASNTKKKVGQTSEAQAAIHEFELICDAKINFYKGQDAFIQVWNRASLKAMKMAALLAVADNYIHPVIQLHHFEWSRSFVMKEINLMTNKLDVGEIGVSDHAKTSKLISICQDVLAGKYNDHSAQKMFASLGIVTFRLLSQLTANISAFKAGLGHKRNLEDAISMLISAGHLIEVNRMMLANTYQYSGKAFFMSF